METLKIDATDIVEIEKRIFEIERQYPDLKLKSDIDEEKIGDCPGTCHYSCFGTAKR